MGKGGKRMSHIRRNMKEENSEYRPEQLLSANNTPDEICDFLKADSISFLSINGLYKAMGQPEGRDQKNPVFTDHCFTGDYQTKLSDNESNEEFSQLSLLSNLE